MEPPKNRNHFRGKARPGRRMEIRYRLASEPASVERVGATRNIGLGGAFILSDRLLAPGTKLFVTIPLPGRNVVSIAEVRWNAEVVDPARRGMGVMFADFEMDDALALEEHFATLTETLDFDTGGETTK